MSNAADLGRVRDLALAVDRPGRLKCEARGQVDHKARFIQIAHRLSGAGDKGMGRAGREKTAHDIPCRIDGTSHAFSEAGKQAQVVGGSQWPCPLMPKRMLCRANVGSASHDPIVVDGLGSAENPARQCAQIMKARVPNKGVRIRHAALRGAPHNHPAAVHIGGDDSGIAARSAQVISGCQWPCSLMTEWMHLKLIIIKDASGNLTNIIDRDSYGGRAALPLNGAEVMIGRVKKKRILIGSRGNRRINFRSPDDSARTIDS